MKISTPRAVDNQAWLWPDARDKPIKCMAATRNLCGDFFEQATAAALGAVRLKTDGTAEVCPDLRIDLTTYLESKSVGATGASIIYASRMRKDLRFCREHEACIWYCLWHHKVKVTDLRTVRELYRHLAAGIRHVTLLPLPIVRDLTRSRALKVLNKHYTSRKGEPLAYGDRSKGYGIGWSTPLNLYHTRCEVEFVHQGSLNVYDIDLPPFTVRTTQAGRLLFPKDAQ
jgi:hypothetical protein